MELFVINRHGEEKPEITEEAEKAKLEKVQHQIEKKRQQRVRQRERERAARKELIEKAKAEASDVVHERIRTDKRARKVAKKRKKRRAKVEVNGFTILGAHTSVKRTEADRVLPPWLANPSVISSNLQNLTVKVSKLRQLDKTLRQQLKINGIRCLFPVQAEVIPFLLQTQKDKDIMFPRDLCVSAPTGSGKTLAFVLPIIQALKGHTVRKIRALIILPTQDLAEQVFRTFKLYAQGTSLEVALITGKHLFSAEQRQLGYLSESFGYVSKTDILVCTAGRLVSHLKGTKGVNLQSLEFLVIDEADRVLESVQDDWLYHLEEHISGDRGAVRNRKILNLCALRKQRAPQKLLFSATLTQDPEKIEKLALFQPKLFSCVVNTEEKTSESVGRYTTPEELTEKYIVCAKNLKPLVLYSFVKREKLTKTIIFTHSVSTSHRLKILLQSLFKSKLKVEEISSSLKGKSRDALIASFMRSEVDLLICTDFLARGIDLQGVRCVISYSAPKHLKTYIHRVGRTARAGEDGLAMTIVHDEQLATFRSVLKKDIEEVKIEEGELEGLSKRYKKALERLKEAVTQEEKKDMDSIISKKKALKKGNHKKRKNGAVAE